MHCSLTSISSCITPPLAYTNAVDFYQGLVRITSGLMVPLTTASLLTYVIIAAAGEAMALDRLHREIGDEVAERLRSLSLAGAGADPSAQAAAPPPPSDLLMDEVARDLHQRLLLRNESTKQIVIESIYRETEDSRNNVEVWSTAPDVGAARPHVTKVYGSRLNDRYLSTRRANASLASRGSAPFPGSGAGGRSGGSTGSWSTVGAGGRVVPGALGGSSSGSSSITGGAERSGSSRQVVSDFSAFSASGSLSFGSPPQADSPARFGGNNATWTGGGAMRGNQARGMDDDDDDDAAGQEDKPLPVAVESEEGGMEVAGDDGSRLKFRMGAISLDQAKRLARQSAYRRA